MASATTPIVKSAATPIAIRTVQPMSHLFESSVLFLPAHCGESKASRRTRVFSFTAREEPKMVEATCHCGAVRVDVPKPPRDVEVKECNCSICRRTGAVLAYYSPRDVRVHGATDTYLC